MFIKIKNCLNNESGGPNVEQLMGIGVSIAIMCGIYYVAAKAYAWAQSSSKIVEVYKK